MEEKKRIIPSDPAYWKKRITEAEEQAQRTAAKYTKKELTYYKDALTEIDNGINALFAQLESGQPITRTQLWQYKRWQDLRTQIYHECQNLGTNQISLIDNCVDQVFNDVIGADINTFTATGLNGTSKAFNKTYLNENWSGTHYSNRVWNNTGSLAASLEKKISDMVVLGKMPDEVKKEVMNEFGVSYFAANRLIRTESSYAFNQASLNRYREMGCSKVEFFAESDCCEACAEHSGEIYNINDAPMIPLHPFAAAAIFLQQGSIAAKIDSITTKIFTSTKHQICGVDL